MQVYRTFLLILFVGAILTISNAYAQTEGFKSETALSDEGVKKIDEGKYDEAIAIFDKLIALDSLKAEYRYEKAFALYLKKDYPKAVELLEKLAEEPTSSPNYYQILGNSYDYMDKQEKAVDAYQAGLRRFPKSGRLFLELGTISMSQHDFGQALQYWENGINVDPSFVSNYYWATKFTAETREKIWAIFYGEIFLNLEPDTKRTAEISEILFKTYQSVLKTGPDANGVLKFSHERTILQGESIDPSRQPLEIAFENTMTQAAKPLLKKKPDVTIELLHSLRTEFLKQWDKNGYDKMYNNIIFERHRELVKAGVFKAYNAWLFHSGAPGDFKKWYAGNKDDFKKFYDWVQKNPMTVNEQHRFTRYE
ncbi:MAG: tetratricopeptide repeat protein [Bacteroidota bacterium]